MEESSTFNSAQIDCIKTIFDHSEQTNDAYNLSWKRFYLISVFCFRSPPKKSIFTLAINTIFLPYKEDIEIFAPVLDLVN